MGLGNIRWQTWLAWMKNGFSRRRAWRVDCNDIHPRCAARQSPAAADMCYTAPAVRHTREWEFCRWATPEQVASSCCAAAPPVRVADKLVWAADRLAWAVLVANNWAPAPLPAGKRGRALAAQRVCSVARNCSQDARAPRADDRVQTDARHRRQPALG